MALARELSAAGVRAERHWVQLPGDTKRVTGSLLPRSVPRVLLSCAATTIAMYAMSADAHATQPASAVQLLHMAMSDASARGSAHEAESGHTQTATITFADDLGARQGQQTISVSEGWRARVLIVNGTAYISGNQAALVHYFGFPAAVARKVGTSWVSIPPSNPAYSTVAADATLPSALRTITPGGHLTETAPTKVDGTPAIGIRGTGPSVSSGVASSSLTLYVSRSAAPLPLRATVSDTHGSTYTIILSDWGEHLALKAPTTAIPVSKL